MQVIRSEFSVEVEPENEAVVDLFDGSFSLHGTVVLHYKRRSPSTIVYSVNCKVCTEFPGYGFCAC